MTVRREGMVVLPVLPLYRAVLLPEALCRAASSSLLLLPTARLPAQPLASFCCLWELASVLQAASSITFKLSLRLIFRFGVFSALSACHPIHRFGP